MRPARALLLTAIATLGCGGGRGPGSGAGAENKVATPAFAAPTAIGPCTADRLEVLEVPLDLGAPYQSFEWLALEHALARHSYATDRVVLLFVPEVNFKEQVVSLLAVRYDVASRSFLPQARQSIGVDPRLAPRHSELASGPVGEDHVVAWTDFVTRGRRGVAFSVSSGTFRPASAAEVAAIPGRSGLATHAAYPPDPDPTTGVSVKLDIMGARATFSRAGAELGSVHFPSLPGAYIAAFSNTRAAFFWNNGKHSAQARVPPEKQRHSYLVGLETGASCRVERELAYPATAVFRRRDWVAFVNALRTEPGHSDCPPGAPCVAPEQSHFAGASLVIFRDRGK
ncbi:MAG TPA: hypothetical protein VM686_11125 [Polyangiaceae bacterium]|nr:hypothetical protein [Polyangiaceae bacterium]